MCHWIDGFDDDGNLDDKETENEWTGVCGNCNRIYESEEQRDTCPYCGSDDITCDERYEGDGWSVLE